MTAITTTTKDPIEESFEQSKENIDLIKSQIKPLSNNKFLAFFQTVWRKWLAVWYAFSSKHPKLSKIIYQVTFFIIFSEGVTLFQFVLLLFLPQVFGQGLAEVEWLVPKILMGTNKEGISYYFSILGKPLAYNTAGGIIIGGGLGYFMAFLIATFLAQVINFPLQRNITFRSHGNPYWQATWYLIGWLLIQPFCDMIGSLWKGIVGLYLGVWPNLIVVILDTIMMGGIAMVIFFFIFRIIFPDYNAVEKRTAKKLETLKASNANSEKIAKTEADLAEVTKKARYSNAEKALVKASTQANAKAIAYFSVNDEIRFNAAMKAAKAKEVAEKEFADASC